MSEYVHSAYHSTHYSALQRRPPCYFDSAAEIAWTVFTRTASSPQQQLAPHRLLQWCVISVPIIFAANTTLLL